LGFHGLGGASANFGTGNCGSPFAEVARALCRRDNARMNIASVARSALRKIALMPVARILTVGAGGSLGAPQGVAQAWQNINREHFSKSGTLNVSERAAVCFALLPPSFPGFVGSGGEAKNGPEEPFQATDFVEEFWSGRGDSNARP
jgi:hypothetical protein